MVNQRNTRNFAIVAHVDHGKSTLADRLLELTGTIEKRNMMEQILDSNPIERERGITIKLAPVRMVYKYRINKSTNHQIVKSTNKDYDNSDNFILNLIDTPGHVDFSYEVSRSLAACEGIILVVDSTQGIQAQTVAHMQLVKARNLKVIPVINKIDLPAAQTEMVKKSLTAAFGFDKEDIIEISAKLGTNCKMVLEAIIQKIPPPSGNLSKPMRALVFSSVYDNHKGVIVFVKIVDGSIDVADKKQYKFQASGAVFLPVEIGVFVPKMERKLRLVCGEVGFIATGLKDLTLARVGDTISISGETVESLPGYQEPKPMVYLGLYPVNNPDFPPLRLALDKLHLSDSSFNYQLRTSQSLGKGFLCGFLGLLHAEIIKERLNKEFNVQVIATAPSVEYRVKSKNSQVKLIHAASDFADPSTVEFIEEPVMETTIYTDSGTVGKVMKLSANSRGTLVNLQYLNNVAQFTYLLPLAEIILDFFDRLKSETSGYASLDYEFYEYRQVDAVKLDIYINHEMIEAFSQIVVRENSVHIANKLVEKLKETIPRHQFQIPIQASAGSKVIARADISSFRKDVTQKLYGGDRTRKDKLLEAQKKGKKRMREFGRVKIPQEVFLEIYKT